MQTFWLQAAEASQQDSRQLLLARPDDSAALTFTSFILAGALPHPPSFHML